MEEQKVLKKQFVLHIIYNMFAFSIIFMIFGCFTFFMVKNMTFSSVDNQLIEAKNDLIQISSDLKFVNSFFNDKIFKNQFKIIDNRIIEKLRNPQVSLILRDINGKVVNETDLGRISDFVSEIDFDKNNLNNIYKIQLGDKYNYRILNIELNYADEIQYAQLLVNIDSEINLINRYLEIIVYAVFIGIILSGIASYILSKKALRPVEDTLKKQTEFVQNVSHELRTPLTIIQAKQELLLQEPDAKIIDKSEEIMLTLNETKRLSKLTKDLMILMRGSESNLQKEEVNIDEFIKKIVEPYKEIIEAQEKTIKLNLNFENYISIDVNKIHQLLVILLDNSIKYTEKEDIIEINTSCKDNKCIIEVKDTGIGISDEGLNRVFDRFYREDKARNRKTGGSGLGLSIANMIVTVHNGTIKVTHNNPKGTDFIIKLPR